MARIRTIKPEFFTSESVIELEPIARLFFISLWCEADREGKLAWKPKTLKYRYLPADEIDINEIAASLVDNDLIDIYEVDGKEYCKVINFENHQVVNNREKSSTLPDASPTRESRVKAEGRKGRERKGREGKGKEGKDSLSENKFSDDDFKCAEYIYSLLKKTNPKIKKPNMNTWAESVRKIREIDKRSHKDICEVFKWANSDSFWQSNILSPDKLRKQFDALEIKMNQKGGSLFTLPEEYTVSETGEF